MEGATCVYYTHPTGSAAPLDAARTGVVSRTKVAATAIIQRRLLAPILGNLRGRRDLAVLLMGFARSLRQSELAAIRFEHFEKTDRGIRLT